MIGIKNIFYVNILSIKDRALKDSMEVNCKVSTSLRKPIIFTNSPILESGGPQGEYYSF